MGGGKRNLYKLLRLTRPDAEISHLGEAGVKSATMFYQTHMETGDGNTVKDKLKG